MTISTKFVTFFIVICIKTSSNFYVSADDLQCYSCNTIDDFEHCVPFANGPFVNKNCSSSGKCYTKIENGHLYY